MATIVITDLSESVELDRKAMQAIAGGARMRAPARSTRPATMRGPRLVDFGTPAPAASTVQRQPALPANPVRSDAKE